MSDNCSKKCPDSRLIQDVCCAFSEDQGEAFNIKNYELLIHSVNYSSRRLDRFISLYYFIMLVFYCLISKRLTLGRFNIIDHIDPDIVLLILPLASIVFFALIFLNLYFLCRSCLVLMAFSTFGFNQEMNRELSFYTLNASFFTFAWEFFRFKAYGFFGKFVRVLVILCCLMFLFFPFFVSNSLVISNPLVFKNSEVSLASFIVYQIASITIPLLLTLYVYWSNQHKTKICKPSISCSSGRTRHRPTTARVGRFRIKSSGSTHPLAPSRD